MTRTVSELIGEIKVKGVDEYVAGVKRVGSETDKAGKQADSSLTKLGGKMQAVGGKMQAVGGTLTKKVTLPLMAVGAFALKAANDVDAGMAAIRIGTGATGKALQGLETVFKNTARNSTMPLADVGTAVADLNTRLGLTGKPLQTMSTQMLNLARITKQDVGTVIKDTTRVFGDWGVEVGKQPATLDHLFKVSQSTGIGMDALGQKLVQFGAPLRQMGIGFEEGAALLGKWEKEGVNTEKVLGSLTIGVGRLAKDGIKASEMPKVFRERLEEIKTSADPVTKAMELFGAKAGPDMAAAIKEGRFSVDDLMSSIGASGETINKAAGDSETFGDKLTRLGNRVKLAAAPIGKELIPIIEKLGAWVEKAAAKFESMSPGMRRLVVVIGLIVAAIGPLLMIGGTLLVMLGSLAIAAGALGVSMGALLIVPLLVAAAIAGLVAAGVLLYKNWDTIKKKLAAVWGAIKNAASAAFAWIRNFISQHAVLIALAVTGPLGALVVWTIRNWGKIKAGVAAAWKGIRSTASRAARGVTAAITSEISAVVSRVSAVWARVRSGLANAWNAIRSAATNAAKGVVSSIAGALGGLVGKLASVGTSAGAALANAIKSAVNAVLGRIKNFSLPTISVAGKKIPGSGSTPFSGLPLLAQGGIAYGPTLAGIGEYPGARINPEVVAPLNTLRSLLADDAARSSSGDTHYHVTFNVTNPVEDMRAFMRRARFEVRTLGAGA